MARAILPANGGDKPLWNHIGAPLGANGTLFFKPSEKSANGIELPRTVGKRFKNLSRCQWCLLPQETQDFPFGFRDARHVRFCHSSPKLNKPAVYVHYKCSDDFEFLIFREEERKKESVATAFDCKIHGV